MRTSTTNDNIAAVAGALFIGIGVLTLIAQITGVSPSPLWLAGAGLLAVGYVGIRRAVATIPDD